MQPFHSRREGRAGFDNPLRQQSGPVRSGESAQVLPGSATHQAAIARQASQARIAHGLQAQAEQKATLFGVQFVEPETGPFRHAISLPQQGSVVIAPGQLQPASQDVVCLRASHEQFRP
jgi:hypothetical protein